LRYAISAVIIHESYDGVYHDVALARAARSVNFDEYVGPICLPFTRHFPDDKGTVRE